MRMISDKRGFVFYIVWLVALFVILYMFTLPEDWLLFSISITLWFGIGVLFAYLKIGGCKIDLRGLLK